MALYCYPTIIATRADQVNRGTFKNTFEYDSVAAATMASNYTRGTGTTGPWAEASRRFASETTGEIRIFLDNPDPNRVWWQTEMLELSRNVQSGNTQNHG